MADLAESLLAAYEKGDSSTYAGICARLHQSKDERQRAAERLLEIVCEDEARRAELAVNTLSFTGIAREKQWHEKLVAVAEKVFSPEILSKLAECESRRLTGVKGRLPTQVRLLRSLTDALLRTEEPRATAFLDAVEIQLAGTALGPRFTKWRQRSR